MQLHSWIPILYTCMHMHMHTHMQTYRLSSHACVISLQNPRCRSDNSLQNPPTHADRFRTFSPSESVYKVLSGLVLSNSQSIPYLTQSSSHYCEPDSVYNLVSTMPSPPPSSPPSLFFTPHQPPRLSPCSAIYRLRCHLPPLLFSDCQVSRSARRSSVVLG